MNANDFKRRIESVTPKGDLSWYVKWISSVFIILGMMMTSLDISLYPINLFFHLIGVSGWFVVGMLWHDRSLIVVNGIAMTIFMMGILKHFFGGAY
tara:strand:+ start:2012 stop:2299 length:288 start_codon:yes stop_codon:yes gene_type:complete